MAIGCFWMGTCNVDAYNLDIKLFALVALTLILIIVLIAKIINNKKIEKPPGPWGLPIIGHLPFLLGKNLAKSLTEMGEKYGEVFSIRLGSFPTIVLNSDQIIREALIDNSDVFSDRPNFFTCKVMNMNTLAFGSYNQRWRTHRKIAETVLRDLNSTDNQFEEIVSAEVDRLVAAFLNSNGEELDPNDEIYLTIERIIYKMCFGTDKACPSDENFKKMVKSTKSFVNFTGNGNPIDPLPWLQYLMPWKANEFIEIVTSQNTASSAAVQEHLESYDVKHHRDITDQLIYESKKYCSEESKNFEITKEEVFSTVRDFIGGSQTVSTAMEWLILYLGAHQDVQRKMQNEIDHVLGSRQPCASDRKLCPYTEAVIWEILRLKPTTPLLVPHAVSKTTIFRNFLVEKGTVVICNYFTTTRNPLLWENPDSFSPERFLDKSGDIDKQKVSSLLSYGIGRRRCPGKQMANSMLFLCLVNIFKVCTITLCLDPDFDGVHGLVYKPKSYKIKVHPRI